MCRKTIPRLVFEEPLLQAQGRALAEMILNGWFHNKHLVLHE